jgi:hypothetical protein
MITKFEVGDTVEIIAHPHESPENLAMNPWVIRRIEITKEGISYTMDSLVNKTATTMGYREDWIRKVRDPDSALELLTKCSECLAEKLCLSGCPDCFHPSGMLEYCQNEGHKPGEEASWNEEDFQDLLIKSIALNGVELIVFPNVFDSTWHWKARYYGVAENESAAKAAAIKAIRGV